MTVLYGEHVESTFIYLVIELGGSTHKVPNYSGLTYKTYASTCVYK